MVQLSWFFIFVTVKYTAVFSSPLRNSYNHYLEYPSVQRFRQYLQIDTSKQENIEYAVNFLVQQAKELDLPICIHRHPRGKPVVIITIQGINPSLPSIMLNSHMDVVPADEIEWEHPPFAAVMDENGDIFARGAQDTKDVGIQYLEAIRRLKQNNVTLLRTLHITYMPDEETGGFTGIKTFLHTEEFRSLNVGFALDEGLPSINDRLYALYVDKRPWQMQFVVHGEGGHGSAMPEASAAEKVTRLLNVITNYRHEQMNISKLVSQTDFGAYTSLNMNVLQGGYVPNVIPAKIEVVVDMRLSTSSKVSDVEDLVNEWLRVAGNGTELHFIRRDDVAGSTQLDDTNPYWVTLKKTVNELGYQIEPVVCPATTDMLVLRNEGFPAVGFSTKVRTVSRFHNNNEYINVVTFLKGIDIYEEIIKNLGNLPPEHKTNGDN